MALSVLSGGGVSVLPNCDVSEIERHLIDENGFLRCVPAAELLSFGIVPLRYFAHKFGIYQFPTVELITLLSEIINGRKCLEIGAGRGDVGRLLKVKMTDSHQQAKPQYRLLYESLGQPPIKYPKDVERLNAKEAIKKYRPEVVLGCWVTHRYDPKKHEAGGNIDGIDSDFIIQRAKNFVFVGNSETHKFWQIPCHSEYRIYHSDGIISRAAHGQNFVAVFKKLRRS